MAFNYAVEKKKFEEMWATLRVEYAAAGMSEDAIQQMYEFDLDLFRQERRFYTHNQQPSDLETVAECCSPTLARYGWIDDLSSPELVQKFKHLKAKDIELLTLWVIEGHTEAEIAQMQSVTRSAISHRIARLKKIFKNF